MDPDLPTTALSRRTRRRPAAESDAGGVERVDALYQRFLVLNDDVLTVCTEWQVRAVGGATVLNDHLDEAYDRRTIGRLVALHRRAVPLLDDLGGVQERFRCYRSRLDAARRLVQEGQRDWFTRPGIDSYHTVWFELHEDLLAWLGRRRGDQPPESPVLARGDRPDHLQEQR